MPTDESLMMQNMTTSDCASHAQSVAGLDIDRSSVSKIEARMVFIDDRTQLYLADVLKVDLLEFFPKREDGRRIHEIMTKLETTRL